MLQRIAKEIEANYRFYYAVAYRHLGNHEDAADAVQNACLKICKYCPEEIPPKKLRAWIAVVCSNESKTMLRKRKYVSGYSEENEEFASPYGNPEDMDFYYEGITFAAINSVPEKYRSALSEYYRDGVPLAAAAKKQGLKEATLRYWRKKVEQKLKEFL